MNAAHLCGLLQGELVGNGVIELTGPSQIDKGIPGTVSFLANPRYEDHVYTTQASVIIVPRDFKPRQSITATLIKVDDVYGAMMFLIDQFSKNGMPRPGISSLASIATSAQIGEEVAAGDYIVIEEDVMVGKGSIIYPQVFIGHGSVIGENVILYPGVRIYPYSKIGDRCIVHANAVIGSDGFGYRPDEKGQYIKIKHVGNVVLEEDVEIGANTVIDRGTMASTLIGKGSKIDNLVQIAHNVQVGRHTVIAAQAGIAGSSRIGNYVRIGGQVGIAGHIEIADKMEIQAQSGVHTGKFTEGTRLFGYPAIPYNDYLKSYAVFKELPKLIRKIEQLEKQLAAVKKEAS